MTMSEWLQLAGFGALFGGVGQCIRIVMGLGKLYQSSVRDKIRFRNAFSPGRLLISLAFGLCAGIASAVSLLLLQTGHATVGQIGSVTVGVETVLTIIAAGYAGADFLEGFVKSRLVTSLDQPTHPGTGAPAVD